jgi:urea carboxylase
VSVEVLRAGTMTTVQDWPGRLGLWEVGVPPSGPMDDRSFRLGNLAVGNDEGAPGLECTLTGPKLRFAQATTVCVCGAEAEVTLDGEGVERWTPVPVPAGGVLDVGKAAERGLRVYVLVAGGLDVEAHLGSASTFTLGRFGGHEGRALRKGDVLASRPPAGVARGPVLDPPELTHAWRIAVTEGPHAAPEFFTERDVEAFYAAEWQVHFNSARTGVRLAGPKPRWARDDGGQAGLHPSNVHDTPYAIGAINYTGDHPIILGPDGPSLGGFVCPATVVTGERWKLGQLRPGDTVRFVAVSEHDAVALRRTPAAASLSPAPVGAGDPRTRVSGRTPAAASLSPAPVGAGDPRTRVATRPLGVGDRDHGVLFRREGGDGAPDVTYRRAGDDNLLVEYGPMVLDLGLRLRVHALAERLAAERLDGIVDLTPGIRSLQLHVDPDVLCVRSALSLARALEDELPANHDLEVPSRVVHLPLSWDDPTVGDAIRRYMSGVRPDAPWCPSNLEFIRRINGLDSVEDVHRVVFGADYLVLGLGDVYLGAPVATPLDPRHRLVTTKYNPTRTHTPESAVGIGGAYLCVYGMEGPGGYQLVGRTVPVWSRAGVEPPWLLRFFDRIRWHEVGAEELLDQRAAVDAGTYEFRVEDGAFSLASHLEFLEREAASIAEHEQRRAAAFAGERAAWAAAGEFAEREAA